LLLINGDRLAQSAEELMRSRYSAFCTKELSYLEQTTDKQLLTPEIKKSYLDFSTRAQFLKLEIVKSEESGNRSTVEFKASYSMDGEERIHHELSTFRKLSGEWFYRDGRNIK
jgi:SEC-C motif-containing protein